jgi:hypothetical protein
MQDVKVEVMVGFMSQYDIMHEYVDARIRDCPNQGAFFECKMQRYVAIIDRLNHSLKGVWRDYKEITIVPAIEKDIGL